MSESNIYRCFSCGAVNNSIDAAWCSCLTSDRTFVCKQCGECFCSAPRAWRKMFWQSTSVELRQRIREKQQSAPPMSAIGSDLQRPIVLVVDDDRVIHHVLGRLLKNFNGTVLYADHGGKALELARTVCPDLIITDALLPGLDGRELSHAVKTTPETSRCKVAVMTGLYKGPRYRAEAIRDYLVDEYLEKPVKAPQIRELIQSVAAKYRQADCMAVAG